MPQTKFSTVAVRKLAKKQLFCRTLSILLLAFLNSTIAHGQSSSLHQESLERFSKHFERSVRRYWRPSRNVNGISTTTFDYSGFASEFSDEKSDFSLALSALKQVDTYQLQRDDDEKAFWINAYNIAAIKLVAEHYPTKSITSPQVSPNRNPWGKKNLLIGEKSYSLEEIEKDILLRRFPDPRIVFAVSCAAVSCPDRFPEIFHGNSIDQQLDNLLRTFLSNRTKGACLYRERSQLVLSWIFKADRHLFNAKGKSSLLDFVIRYLPSNEAQWVNSNRNKLTVEYFRHDWTLNDTRGVASDSR